MGEVASLPFLARAGSMEKGRLRDVGTVTVTAEQKGDAELAQRAAKRHVAIPERGGAVREKGKPKGCPSSCCFYTELNPEKTLCG